VVVALALASATAVAEEGKGGPADAARPAAEGPPDVTAMIADEAAARRTEEAQQAQAITELRAKLDAMRAELEAERAARLRAEQSEAHAVDALGAAMHGPPAVTTARTGLSLTGFAQNDFAVRQSSQDELNPSGTPLNEDRFTIRRARIRAALDRQWVAGAIEFDGNTVNGPTARVLDVEASFKWTTSEDAKQPLLMATIGAFKIPFGFEIGQSDRERLFLERSLSERAMFPGEYDLGARVQGGWRFIRYALAVMNGEPAGEKGGFPYRDPNAAKDVLGRVGVDTPVSSGVWVAAGFSGLTGQGFHAGTPATKPTLQWIDRNANGVLDPNEISVVPGTSAVASKNFGRFGFGADLRIGADVPRLGQAILYGELYWAKNLDRAILPADPVAFGRDYREFGYYVALTQELGPHGMAGVRWDFYNPDADSVNQVMGATLPTALAYDTLSLTAALRSPSGRLIAEYDLNRNHNGRDALGNPVNLRDDAFTIRGEISF
jgi:hypothetical protein